MLRASVECFRQSVDGPFSPTFGDAWQCQLHESVTPWYQSEFIATTAGAVIGGALTAAVSLFILWLTRRDAQRAAQEQARRTLADMMHQQARAAKTLSGRIGKGLTARDDVLDELRDFNVRTSMLLGRLYPLEPAVGDRFALHAEALRDWASIRAESRETIREWADAVQRELNSLAADLELRVQLGEEAFIGDGEQPFVLCGTRDTLDEEPH